MLLIIWTLSTAAVSHNSRRVYWGIHRSIHSMLRRLVVNVVHIHNQSAQHTLKHARIRCRPMCYSSLKILLSPPKKGGSRYVFACLFVYMFVCLSARLLKKLWPDFGKNFGMVGCGPRSNRVDVGGNPDHDPPDHDPPDPGIVFILGMDSYRQPNTATKKCIADAL